MIEIRFHARGGQGAVTAASILAGAFFFEGKDVQSFASYGGERRGAPVLAFTRVNNEKIRLRSNIYNPDHVVVLDAALLKMADVTSGLKHGGWILSNSDQEPDSLGFPQCFHVATIDANSIAAKYHLGSRTAPIVNTVILGAFSKVTGLVRLDSIFKVMSGYVLENLDGNKVAAKEAFHRVNIGRLG